MSRMSPSSPSTTPSTASPPDTPSQTAGRGRGRTDSYTIGAVDAPDALGRYEAMGLKEIVSACSWQGAAAEVSMYLVICKCTRNRM